MVSAKQLTSQDNRGVYKQYHRDEAALGPKIQMHVNGKYKTVQFTDFLPKVPKLYHMTPEDRSQMFSYQPTPVFNNQEKLGYEVAKGFQRYQSELAEAQAYKEYLGSRSLQDAKYAAPSIERMASTLSNNHIVGENSIHTVSLAPGMPPIGGSSSNGLSVNTDNLYDTSSATPETAKPKHSSSAPNVMREELPHYQEPILSSPDIEMADAPEYHTIKRSNLSINPNISRQIQNIRTNHSEPSGVLGKRNRDISDSREMYLNESNKNRRIDDHEGGSLVKRKKIHPNIANRIMEIESSRKKDYSGLGKRKRANEKDEPNKKWIEDTVRDFRRPGPLVMARDTPRPRGRQPQLVELQTMGRISRMSNLASRAGTEAEGVRARQRLEQYRRDNNLPAGSRYLGRYNGPDNGYIPVNTRFSY